MDKLTIDNLFPNKKTDNDLDVYSLYNRKKNKEEFDLNIDRLITLREEKKKKLMVQYDKIFKLCVNKIHVANNLNKLSVIYEVPDGVHMFPDYSTIDCLNFIKDKLDDLCFESIILNIKQIFISWENIGKLRKAKAKEKERIEKESW